jgi:Trk K+ transport system NAD-binding subunit
VHFCTVIHDQKNLKCSLHAGIARILPSDCILVSIRRGKKVIIPHGKTGVQAGDHIVTLVSSACVNDTRKALSEGREPSG